MLLLLSLLLLLLGGWSAGAVSNLYFHIPSNRQVCFVNEVAQDATLVLSFEHQDFASKPIKMVIATQDGVMEEFPLSSPKGRFAYLAKDTGQHRICLQSSVEEDLEEDEHAWKAKFFLKAEVLLQDSGASQLSELANRTHVVTLQQELTSITNRVEMLLRDLQTARVKEAHFRDQGEKVNEYVLWLSIAQTIFLLATAASQSIHLHNFFIHKKIA